MKLEEMITHPRFVSLEIKRIPSPLCVRKSVHVRAIGHDREVSLATAFNRVDSSSEAREAIQTVIEAFAELVK